MHSLRSHAGASILAALFVLLAACGTSEPVASIDDGEVAPLASDSGETGRDDAGGAVGSEDPGSAATSDPDATESDDGEDDGDAVEPSDSATAGLPPEEAAAINQPNLRPADDARDIEVLSVSDGSITSLREAVTGDRPVLLWFWAPH